MKISEINGHVKQIKNDLKKRILSMPDNPKISRIGGGTTCFVLNSVNLGESWSPFYHDFRKQYQEIAEIVDRLPIEKLAEQLEEIAKRESIKTSGGTLKLHPEVAGRLKGLLTEV
ncbi:MAG: hypothetical protein JXB42_10430 [Deltaproteobacteria bacterium]|nr:hypothetical protein [Deltaproteobacteria bacterium]